MTLKCGSEVTQGNYIVPLESLGTVSYSPSIVGLTMAVSLAISEIFSVEELPDLEIWV